MATSDAPITIKKYANRRLYDASSGTHTTLEALAAIAKAGKDFVVYDAKGGDITRSVLTQIVFEQENKEGQSLLPINFLRLLIRFYGDSMQMSCRVILRYRSQPSPATRENSVSRSLRCLAARSVRSKTRPA